MESHPSSWLPSLCRRVRARPMRWEITEERTSIIPPSPSPALADNQGQLWIDADHSGEVRWIIELLGSRLQHRSRRQVLRRRPCPEWRERPPRSRYLQWMYVCSHSFRSGTDEVGIRDSRDVIQFCERDQESVLPVRQQPRLPSTVSQRTFLSTLPAEPKLMEDVHRAGYWDSTEATLVPTATPSASVLSLSVLNWIVGIPSTAGLVDTTCTAHSIFLLSCLQFAILFLLLFPLLAPPFSNHFLSHHHHLSSPRNISKNPN